MANERMAMCTRRVVGILLLMAVLLTSMAACGDADSEKVSGKEYGDSGLTYEDIMEDDTVAKELENEEVPSSVLEGTWESAEYMPDETRFIVTVWSGVIQIYYMHEHSADVCWVGTCPDMISAKFTSEYYEQYRNKMLFEYDSMEFIYLEDTLFFIYDNEDGEREGVYLEKISDTVLMEVSLETVSVVQEIPDDDPAISVSPIPSEVDDTEPEYEIETGSEEVCVHNFGIGIVTRAATCTASGVKTYTCTKCGAVQTETIPATGHNYVYQVKVQATCGKAGVRTSTCTECGDSYDVTIDPTGEHKWVETIETTEVPEEGHYGTEITSVQGYQCNICGYASESVSDIESHVENSHGGSGGYTDTDITKEEKVYVVDTPAHTEEVVTGRRCSVCGATE